MSTGTWNAAADGVDEKLRTPRRTDSIHAEKPCLGKRSDGRCRLPVMILARQLCKLPSKFEDKKHNARIGTSEPLKVATRAHSASQRNQNSNSKPSSRGRRTYGKWVYGLCGHYPQLEPWQILCGAWPDLVAAKIRVPAVMATSRLLLDRI